MAFDRIEPLGEARADLRMARLMSLIANLYRDEKKHPAPFTAVEFMLRFDEPEPPADDAWKAQKAAFSALQAAQQRKKNKVK